MKIMKQARNRSGRPLRWKQEQPVQRTARRLVWSEQNKPKVDKCKNQVAGRGSKTISHYLSKYFVAEHVKLDFYVMNSLDCMCQYFHLFRHQQRSLHWVNQKNQKYCPFAFIKQSKIKHGKVQNFYELIGFHHPPSSLLEFQAQSYSQSIPSRVQFKNSNLISNSKHYVCTI